MTRGVTKQKIILFAGISGLIGILGFFDIGLAVGLALIGLLTFILFLLLFRFVERDKILLSLFLITLLIHIGSTVFIHYTEFYPFGGREGDQENYELAARELAGRFAEGNFSFEGIAIRHYYPVLVGGFYTYVIDSQLAVKLLNAWLVAASVLLAYFLMREFNVRKKWAFATGIGIALYPSYMYYGSLLLREVIVAVLAILGLFLIVKLIKRFSWSFLAALCISCAVLIDFRFYIGLALLATIVFALPIILRGFSWRKQVIYGFLILLVFGFLPQLSGLGYFGKDAIFYYTQPEQITHQREVAYRADKGATKEERKSSSQDTDPVPKVLIGPNAEIVEREKWGAATIIVEANTDNPLLFVRNYLISGSYVALGPLPWHLSQPRHFFILFETIPWYIAVFLIAIGVFRSRRQWYLFFPLVIFSLFVFGALALLIDNFGVYTRVRIPAFVALLPLAALFFDANRENIILAKFRSYTSKWRSLGV